MTAWYNFSVVVLQTICYITASFKNKPAANMKTSVYREKLQSFTSVFKKMSPTQKVATV